MARIELSMLRCPHLQVLCQFGPIPTGIFIIPVGSVCTNPFEMEPLQFQSIVQIIMVTQSIPGLVGLDWLLIRCQVGSRVHEFHQYARYDILHDHLKPD